MKNIYTFPSVSIVVPCYKNPHETVEKLLKSIKVSNYPKEKLEIVIVEILKRVQNFKSKRVFVNRMIGYGEAANIGIKKASGKVILLCNPDIKFSKGAIVEMITYLNVNERVGVLGPKIMSFSNRSKVSGYDLPVISVDYLLGNIRPVNKNFLNKSTNPFEVEWISGSIMMFTKSLWKKIGGFDNSYFLYWEDSDFCIRIKRHGFKTFIVPRAVCWHKGSESVGEENISKTYYLKRNWLYFYYQHAGFLGKGLELLKSILFVTIKTTKILLGREIIESKAYIYGVVDFYSGNLGRLRRRL